jgi:hypothetical protein
MSTTRLPRIGPQAVLPSRADQPAENEDQLLLKTCRKRGQDCQAYQVHG